MCGRPLRCKGIADGGGERCLAGDPSELSEQPVLEIFKQGSGAGLPDARALIGRLGVRTVPRKFKSLISVPVALRSDS